MAVHFRTAPTDFSLLTTIRTMIMKVIRKGLSKFEIRQANFCLIVFQVLYYYDIILDRGWY
jgi:hypothetical protein